MPFLGSFRNHARNSALVAMSNKSNLDRVWEIASKHVCMFVTKGAKGARARPLDPRPDRREGAIYFLTDARGTKDHEIEQDDEICMIFIDAKTKAYLSITGTAAVINDPQLAKKYWKKGDEVWWPQRHADSNLRVLRVLPSYAEMWDGPADPQVAAREFAIARETGQKPNLGENRKVFVPMKSQAATTPKKR
jgi:general stress protein 26